MDELNKQNLITTGRLLLQDALCRNWYIVHIDDKENGIEKPKSKLVESGADTFETIEKFRGLVCDYVCEATKNASPRDRKMDEIRVFASIADEIGQPFYDIIREGFDKEPISFCRNMIEVIYSENKPFHSPLYSGVFIKDGKERHFVFP